MKVSKIVISIFFILIVGLGCSSVQVKTYVHPMADFLSIKRVAVMEFENLSDDKFASRKIREIFVTEILASGAFDVVEFGEMQKVIKEMGIQNTSAIDTDTLKKFGKSLGVQGIIFGSVEEYKKSVPTGTGSFPEVAINVRMVDVETGIIIWTASNSKGGGATVSFLGIGEVPYISELTREVVKEVVDSLVLQIPIEG